MKRGLFFFLLVFSQAVSGQSNAFSIQKKLKNTPAGPDQYHLYKELASYYQHREVDSAIFYISEGMRLAEKLHDTRQQALFILQLGKINEKHGNVEVARKLVTDALKKLRTSNDKIGLTSGYAELGLIEGKRLNSQASDKAFKTAFALLHGIDTVERVEVFTDIGEVYESRGDTSLALNYFLKALDQFGTKPYLHVTYFKLIEKIGQLYLHKGNPKEALRYLRLGLSYTNTQALADTETELLDQEGKAYEQMGRKNKAMELYKTELNKAKQNKLPFEQAKALISIARILKAENSVRSLANLQKALEIAVKTNDKPLAATIYEAMTEIYRQNNNYREALLTLDEHHRLLDSLFGADKAKELAGLDSSYELIESRGQVENLQALNAKKNREIKIAVVLLTIILISLGLLYIYFRKVSKLNRALEKSNRVKDKLFSVLGHDLRGPIGSTVQLVGLLQEEQLGAKEQNEMLSLLKEQSESILEVLESVLIWGKSHLQGIEVKAESFHPSALIDKALGLLNGQACTKGVSLSNLVNADLVITGDPNHFDFIIRNLVTNAIKFSYPDGLVEINAKEDADANIVFSVKDQGIGISNERINQFQAADLETSYGTGGEKGTGIGLRLVKEFLNAGGGKIWVESAEGKGTVFYFMLTRSTSIINS